jgi:hypothetical protein
MTMPTDDDVKAAKAKVEQIRKEGGTRCEREIAREWYRIVKRDSRGFEGLASYVPFRAPDAPLSDIYEGFAAKIRRKYGKQKSRGSSIQRERLDEECGR